MLSRELRPDDSRVLTLPELLEELIVDDRPLLVLVRPFTELLDEVAYSLEREELRPPVKLL